jgi:DNA-directed RNA polymerase beta subunit
MGQMWESLLGKLNALVGSVGRFGVPFTGVDKLTASCDRLHAAGAHRMGREQLYSGVTGEPLDGLAFIGIVFYL